MPSLIAFGRRWNIASDDFVFPELTEAVWRVGWVIVAVVIFLLHSPTTCSSWEWLGYIIVMIVINLVSAAFCLAISLLSARGCILEVSARKHVATLLYVRVPLFVAEVIWTLTSTILIFGIFNAEFCFSIHGIRLVVLLEWLLIAAVGFGIFIVFNLQGGRSMEHSVMIERRYWRNKFTLCKIRQDQTMRAALDEIAALIASFFADNDFVMSDIVAGLLLLVHSPHKHLSSEAQVTDIKKLREIPDWMQISPSSLKTISRFLDFAVAIYGWPTYMLNNCGCAPWYRLCRKVKCCRRCSSSEIIVVEDNCFSCHTGAFMLESLCDETDLFFISFRNRLFQVPFVALTDHTTKSIVIVIRGSASLLDLVTDLSLNDDIFSVDVDSDPILAEDHELDEDGEVRVHRGMLHGARYVYEILKSNKVIEDMLVLNPTYGITVCGHSLGAGVATLLTLLLKQTYTDIRCYSFSPPGCVISKHGIPETESHVLSLFVGDDFIPRISYQSIQTLKGHIDQEIFSTTKAKYEILIKGFFKLFFSAPWELHTASSENDGTASTSTRDCRRLIENRETEFNYGARDANVENGLSTESAESDQQRIQLHPPGRLLRLALVDDKVEMKWVDYHFLNEIQLTGTILSDHLPHRVRKIVRRACNENPTF